MGTQAHARISSGRGPSPGAYDALAHVPAEDIADLRDAFDQANQPIYTDLVHVNEEGNRLIAERIADVLNEKALAY